MLKVAQWIRQTPAAISLPGPMPINRFHLAFLQAVMTLGAPISALSVCTGPPALEAKIHAHPSADAYAELGSWFGEHSQFECSAAALRTGLQLEPKSAKLNYLLGLTLLSSGRADDALRPLQRSIELDPKVLSSHILLASAFAQLQRAEDAKTQWQAALMIDPSSIAALEGLSKIDIAAGDFDAAIQLLRAAPPSEDIALDLALVYAQQGNVNQAIETLSAAHKTYPSSIRVTDALAIAYSKMRRLEDAKALLDRSLKLHPEDSDGEHIYLRILVLSGDMAAARPLAVKLLTAEPHSFDLLYMSGVIENQVGDYAAAKTHLAEAVSLNPQDSSTHFHFGLALMHLQDYPAAREQFERAVALDPSNPESRFQLGTVLRNLGETQLAKEQFKLYQQASHTKELTAVANAKAEEAAQKLAAGDAKQAVALYREAVEATPQDAALIYQLALALDRAGDTAAERTALEQVLAIEPAQALAQNQLGFLISRDGDPVKAEEHFRMAVKASPGYANAWINLAATLAMQSRFPEAQQAVAEALKLEPANQQALDLRSSLPATPAPH